MKKKHFFLVAVAILLIVCLLIPASCIPKGDDASPEPTSTDALQSRIASLESKVSTAQSEINTLKSQSQENLQPVIDQLHQKISSLESQIGVLQSEVAALEVVKEEEEVQAAEVDMTRWSMDVELDLEGIYSESDIDVSYSCSPTRIEEEDTYSIRVYIRNLSDIIDIDLEDAILTIIFTPKSRDTSIDTANTYLDSTNRPYLDWDYDFRPTPASGTKVSVDCRRIRFTSEELPDYVLEKRTGDDSYGGSLVLKFDFDLAYAK